jgi:hypothetical protein
MEFMDAKSLAHFNLKPSNVLFFSTQTEDFYKVSDYGFESDDLTSEKIWQAPELGTEYGEDGDDNEFLRFREDVRFDDLLKKREFNSLNPLHVNYNPIKFDVFRAGLILL